MEDTIARFHEFEFFPPTYVLHFNGMKKKYSYYFLYFFHSYKQCRFLNLKELISIVIKIWWITNNFLHYAIFNRENEKEDLGFKARRNFDFNINL